MYTGILISAFIGACPRPLDETCHVGSQFMEKFFRPFEVPREFLRLDERWLEQSSISRFFTCFGAIHLREDPGEHGAKQEHLGDGVDADQQDRK